MLSPKLTPRSMTSIWIKESRDVVPEVDAPKYDIHLDKGMRSDLRHEVD